VEPQREGEPYCCYRGGDGKPLVELASDENGHPLRSAACLADNPPLLSREEFLAAIREQCETDELAIPEWDLVCWIDHIESHRIRDRSAVFVRLRDAFAAIPCQPSPTGDYLAFVGEAKWGADAIMLAESELRMLNEHVYNLRDILSGLGEPG
jgi:hypothetical protein